MLDVRTMRFCVLSVYAIVDGNCGYYIEVQGHEEYNIK